MAENNKLPPDPTPLVELTKEARAEIEKMGDDLDRAEAVFDDFEELGLDVSKVRERIAWSRKARDIVLKHT